MRIKMPAVRIAQADADSAAEGGGGAGAQPSPPDTLTCGACRRHFALADIVRFIQHKIASCDKDPSFGNCFSAGPGSDGEDGSRGGAVSASSSSGRRASLLSARRGPGSRVHTPPLSASPSMLAPPDLIQDGGASSTPKRLLDDEGETSTPKRRASTSPLSSSPEQDVKPRIKQERVDGAASSGDDHRKSRDAESNTMHTEPSVYVCSSCSARVQSAWRLLQHAQHVHGARIYVESSPPPPAAPAPLPPAAPAAPAPPPLRHHPLLPPPDLHSPFGLLRLPLPASMPSLHAPAPAPLFARPTHHDHRFRMEQLVSEQFRHHGLNLAAAAAAVAANSLPPHAPFPSPADRPPSSSGARDRPPTSQPLSLEPQLDFYSQRLRRLAGTTSPGAAAGNSSSPSPRKHSPPFASPSPSRAGRTPPASGDGPTADAPSPTAPERRSEPSGASDAPVRPAPPPPPPAPRAPPTPPKDAAAPHACEFCGKKFRFRSNLLVHRRAHTGEKPYKCSVCDHACAQSSKLKRHMRIHRAADGRGEPDSADSGDDSEEEEERPEEEEEDGGEEEEEEELDDEEEDEAEDLTVSGGAPPPERRGPAARAPPPHAPASLVGELMDKFGLSNIAQYSEAYKQALQESGDALKWRLASKDRDNNNVLGAVPPGAEKLDAPPQIGALRLKEEFAKLPGAGAHAHALFNPFENPFEASKRMKLDMERGEGWWLPALHAQRAPDSLFDGLKASANGLLQSPLLKSKDGRRNDTCEFCGKVFKNCSNLTVHRRSHTGEKPYKCELCSYACAQSSKLTRHMKTHGRLGKDVYRCRFCEMPFSVPSTLEKHMRKCVVNQSNGGGSLGALSDDSSACRDEPT